MRTAVTKSDLHITYYTCPFNIAILHQKLLNEQLHDLYSSPNIIQAIKSKRMRWAGYVVRMGDSKGAYRVLVGKPKGKRLLGRPTYKWEDNINLVIQEVGWGGMD